MDVGLVSGIGADSDDCNDCSNVEHMVPMSMLMLLRAIIVGMLTQVAIMRVRVNALLIIWL